MLSSKIYRNEVSKIFFPNLLIVSSFDDNALVSGRPLTVLSSLVGRRSFSRGCDGCHNYNLYNFVRMLDILAVYDDEIENMKIHEV